MTDVKAELKRIIDGTPEDVPEPAPFLQDAHPHHRTNGTSAPVGKIVADVEREPVTWLWHPRIAVGKLTVVDGDPGLGKSTMMYDIAARVSRGESMPDGDPYAPAEAPAGVVVINSEDGVGDTMRPRLEAAGADLKRIVVVSMVPDPDSDQEGRERVLTIPDDLHHIEAAARRVNARLVIIDPLMAHLGRDTNSFRDQDVRRALAPLSDFADRARLAIVAVRHLNKMSGGSALYRGGGSIGIIGAARVGLLVGRDPEDDERVILAPTKNNLARLPRSLAFSLVESDDDPDVARVVWEGPVDISAHELLSGQPARAKKEEIVDWLTERLAAGPIPSKDLIKEGESMGFSRRTIFRAKDEAGVKARAVGSPAHGGHWEWELETMEATDESSPF